MLFFFTGSAMKHELNSVNIKFKISKRRCQLHLQLQLLNFLKIKPIAHSSPSIYSIF